jgi:hypothetical protein
MKGLKLYLNDQPLREIPEIVDCKLGARSWLFGASGDAACAE